MKDSKISVKPFLNKNLSPQKDGGFDLKYPVYYQITYKRKNTQVKSHFDLFHSSLEGLRNNELEQINFECDVLKKTALFELKRNDATFTLTGIKERYDVYILPLDNVFEEHLKKRLIKCLRLTNTEFLPILKFEGFEVTFSLLYKASKLLIENFSKQIPLAYKEEIDAYQKYTSLLKNKNWGIRYFTVLDWYEPDFRDSLRSNFIKFFDEKSSNFDKTVSILNSIVEERIKFL